MAARAETDRARQALRTEIVRVEWRDRRPEVIDRLAAAVWEARENREPVVPTVFNLTGMSADEIREVAPFVDQTSTSREERIALNRLANTPLEY